MARVGIAHIPLSEMHGHRICIIECFSVDGAVLPDYVNQLDLQGVRNAIIKGWYRGGDDGPLTGLACEWPTPIIEVRTPLPPLIRYRVYKRKGSRNTKDARPGDGHPA